MGDVIRMIRQADQREALKQHRAKKNTQAHLKNIERKGRMPPEFPPDGCA